MTAGAHRVQGATARGAARPGQPGLADEPHVPAAPHPAAPPSRPGSCAVVVCAYTEDRWEDLVGCLASVRQQSRAPEEVIVVIDHNDALLRRATAMFPWANVVANRNPRGLSGGRNQGVAVSVSEVVAFIDDDAFADSCWLEHLLDAYSGPDVVGVGGRLEPVWPQQRPRWFPAEFDWTVGCSYVGLPASTADVRNLIGANMSFRRHVFDTVGGFKVEHGRRGDRPIGNDDTELCIRARQHCPAWRMRYEPSAVVHHLVSERRATPSYFLRRCFDEGVSKSNTAHAVGRTAALESERAYVRRVLPAAVVRRVRTAARRDRAASLLQAAAVVAGVGAAGAGYLRSGLAR